jgi:acetyltransferase-like isoleucine patch superfamily enzyme/ubiquinone/menaquinone biosynthesis C-methylase UbiE
MRRYLSRIKAILKSSLFLLKRLDQLVELMKQNDTSLLKAKLKTNGIINNGLILKGIEQNTIIKSGYNLAANTIIDNQTGSLSIGNNFRTGAGAQVLTLGGNIKIDDNVLLNSYSIIYGNGGVEIGSNTQFAAHCIVISANHKFERTDIPISRQGENHKGIKIGADVWVGTNAVILDGVEIGDGAIIGANSVVTKSIEAYAIVAGNPAQVIKGRTHNDVINIQSIDTVAIDYLYQKEFIAQKESVERVLNFNPYIINSYAEEERVFPGDKKLIENGYYHTMLKRYLFTGKYFSKDKKILDSCCGVGWGTFLLSQYAKEVIAFDLEQRSVDFATKEWPASNIKFMVGDALDFHFMEDSSFDVVTAMETIEHFTKENGTKYLKNICRLLKKGGHVVGTSAFPSTRKQADELCSINPYHPYIWTRNELAEVLSAHFSVYTIINGWMFIAEK